MDSDRENLPTLDPQALSKGVHGKGGPRMTLVGDAPRAQSAGGSADQVDVALATAGDVRAFERLYRGHVARVHALARRMLAAEAVPEVTQDVFVRAWQKLATFRGDSAFGTWLHRLAVNVILARRAVLRIESRRLDDDPQALDAVPGRPSASDLSLDFDSAIAHLPAGARQVFVLHDIEGYRHEEMASLLGVTTGTTKAQLHRARMILRERLER